MTTTKQCCGNCHWFKAHGKSPLGGCEAPIPEAAYSRFWVDTGHGETCPTFRQRGERLPQRFRYRFASDGLWSYGLCRASRNGGWFAEVLNTEVWCGLDDNVTNAIREVLSPRAELEWIDRDYGWEDLPGKDSASS